MNKSDKLKHKALKPVKRHQELSFAEYALKATENLPKEFQGRSFYYVQFAFSLMGLAKILILWLNSIITRIFFLVTNKELCIKI